VMCDWWVVVFLSGCQSRKKQGDLPGIIEKGRLVAITSYSPISYFIYHGEPMGYEYELLKMFSDHLGLKLEIKLARDLEEMIRMLEKGEGDLIAYGLTITTERRKQLSFTHPMNVTRQVLVQRKPDNWRQMKLHNIEKQLIRSPFELSGKTIHVRSGSAYLSRIKNLGRINTQLCKKHCKLIY